MLSQPALVYSIEPASAPSASSGVYFNPVGYAPPKRASMVPVAAILRYPNPGFFLVTVSVQHIISSVASVPRFGCMLV